MEALPHALDDLEGDDVDEDGDEDDDCGREEGRRDVQHDPSRRDQRVRAGSAADREGSCSSGGGVEEEEDVVCLCSGKRVGEEPLDVLIEPGASHAAGALARNGAGQRATTIAAAEVAEAAAAGGSGAVRLTCRICSIVIQRHSLVCSACSVAFHLDCLAARWSATEAGTTLGVRFGGVPEQGHCPSCGALHSWMGMLRGMNTIGWGNKRHGRRG